MSRNPRLRRKSRGKKFCKPGAGGGPITSAGSKPMSGLAFRLRLPPDTAVPEQHLPLLTTRRGSLNIPVRNFVFRQK